MKRRLVPSMAALALIVGLADCKRADGSYAYSTTTVVTSVSSGSFGGPFARLSNTQVQFLSTSAFGVAVPSTTEQNIAAIAVTSTDPPSSATTFTVNYTVSVTIFNIPPPGSSADNSSSPLQLTGQLTLSGVNNGSGGVSMGTITNTFFSPTTVSATIGGELYTLQAGFMVAPTVNGAQGFLTGVVIAGVIPEPASVGLVGLGGLGLLFAFRRSWTGRRSA